MITDCIRYRVSFVTDDNQDNMRRDLVLDCLSSQIPAVAPHTGRIHYEFMIGALSRQNTNPPFARRSALNTVP
jgi:hypothetical protein